MTRLTGLVAPLLGVLLVVPTGFARESSAADGDGPLRAAMICEAPASAGRFRCDVELRVRAGSLAWAEVQVVHAADFILPLRGRLGPREASTHDADIFRWSIGFVARDRGSGDVTVRVRAVVCHGDACSPSSVDVVGSVVVGR